MSRGLLKSPIPLRFLGISIKIFLGQNGFYYRALLHFPIVKILFLAKQSPNDKKIWSGTFYYLFKTLNKEHDIEWICDKYYTFFSRLYAAYARLKRIAFRKKFLYTHSEAFAKRLAIRYAKLIGNKKFDFLFAPSFHQVVPYLKTDMPIVLLEDAYFPDLINYYEFCSKLHPRSIDEASRLFDSALKRSTKVIFSSEWAKDSVNKNLPSDKYAVIKFGANLDFLPSRNQLAYEPHAEIRLLFVGVEWERKGGDIVTEAFSHLLKCGYEVNLTIAGCNPPLSAENIKIFPFLDKHNPQQVDKLVELYGSADFFVLPTRAECAGIVFCEASAFGLPSLTSDTGGIADYVENGINGYRLPLTAKGEDYAKKIVAAYQDKPSYLKLRKSTRDKYDRELNWDSWLKEFNNVLNGLQRTDHP